MAQEVLVDARWLLPPEPLEKVLLALDSLKPGQRIRFLMHREPYPLYDILEKMGFTYCTHMIEDGCFEILIQPKQP